ncbi:unnamed protein product [Schistocephalus solidus]|uniref:Uncharacterized protein n=1 Tax=Schistocephalus solidus TaxID=70667 RepID=A0A183TMZ7_SCHSO|nr:unnamed protein product [Schistocephalus solidus]
MCHAGDSRHLRDVTNPNKLCALDTQKQRSMGCSPGELSPTDVPMAEVLNPLAGGVNYSTRVGYVHSADQNAATAAAAAAAASNKVANEGCYCLYSSYALLLVLTTTAASNPSPVAELTRAHVVAVHAYLHRRRCRQLRVVLLVGLEANR